MDTEVIAATISAAAAAYCGLLTWRSSRRSNEISARATDVSAQVADLGWVKEIRQDAMDARKEVDALEDQVRTLTRQLGVVTREAEYWISQYQMVHRTAWRPGVTLEQLRQLLGPDAPRPAAGRG